jgi:excisionase family DNA binding protein
MAERPGFDGDDLVLDADEAGALLRLSRRYVWRLAREGKLPAFRYDGSRHWRFMRSDVLAYRDRAREQSATPAVQARSTADELHSRRAQRTSSGERFRFRSGDFGDPPPVSSTASAKRPGGAVNTPGPARGGTPHASQA